MKKLEVSKILVLMVLSAGLIACGSVQQGLNDQGLSEEELALKRAEGGQGRIPEGGQGYKPGDEGGQGTVKPIGKVNSKIPEGGQGLVADEYGDQSRVPEGGQGYVDEGGQGLTTGLNDNILTIKGYAEKGVTSIGFIFNGKEQFTAAVNKKDQSYMIKIELSDQDLKQLILDVVNGPKVDTIMITSGAVKVYSFKK
jgi:hypothetical protein